MKKYIKPEHRYRIKVQDRPNYGLMQVLDKRLQKQLDDLNEMKRLSYSIKNR